MAGPLRFDFLISNPGHHLAMSLPVIASLRELGDSCRLLSLCELRGFATPTAEIGELAACRRVLPWRLRRSPAAGASGTVGSARRRARALIWRSFLGPRVRSILRQLPDLVILPNDAAFPYDRIARLLRRWGIPFLLFQEGIRFPLPGVEPESSYGRGGALAIAAWGDASAEYFRRQGVPAERIHTTGSPRFDGTQQRSPAAAERARGRWRLGARTLLLLTNPIDDLGFCSTADKLALVRRFADGIAPLFDDPDFSLVVRPHGRESPGEYRPLSAQLPADRVRLLADAPLDELFGAGRAAVVLASTVGLEALLYGLPLGVLEIPGHGFQYDYVQSGAALGLTWIAPLGPQIAELLDPSEQRMKQTRAYLRRQLNAEEGAARRVAELARSLAGRTR